MLKKGLNLLICFSLLVSSSCFAAPTGKALVFAEENEYAQSKVFVDSYREIIYEESSLGDIKVEVERSTKANELNKFVARQYDDDGNLHFTVTIDEDRQIVQYDHKKKETTYPLKDGAIIAYFSETEVGVEFADLSESQAQIDVASTYYSDNVYSYELSPAGSILVNRQV